MNFNKIIKCNLISNDNKEKIDNQYLLCSEDDSLNIILSNNLKFNDKFYYQKIQMQYPIDTMDDLLIFCEKKNININDEQNVPFGLLINDGNYLIDNSLKGCWIKDISKSDGIAKYQIKDKIQEFSDICGDWDYRRNTDMTQAQILSVDLINDEFHISCGRYDAELDDYIFCPDRIIKDKNIFKQFLQLDIENREDVFNFISTLNCELDWENIEKNLCIEAKSLLLNEEEKNSNFTPVVVVNYGEKFIFLNMDVAQKFYERNGYLYHEEQSYEKYETICEALKEGKHYIDDKSKPLKKVFVNYDNIDDISIKVPCKILGEGWFWHKYNDGSGHLESPEGKQYMSYDLDTNEYQVTNDSHYNFFPLSYYYMDGVDPSKFKPFTYMEKLMERILEDEKGMEK